MVAVTKTAIEMDPPRHAMGWGERNDLPHHRLMKERREAERSAEFGCYREIKQLIEARSFTDLPMVKFIKEQFTFDAGWDCDVADRLLYGRPATVDQNPIGTCVGAGAGSAVGSKITTEIIIEGDAENPLGTEVNPSGKNIQLPHCAIPVIDYHYGCGKMNRYWDKDDQRFTRSNVRLGDGSYCSAQIWALQFCGILPADQLKVSGLVVPQTQNVRRYAGNGDNFLNDHLPIALNYRMENSAQVKSADDLLSVIGELFQPCMICSNWGFAPSQYIEGLGWIYKHSGSWSHNMSLVAVIQFKGNWYVKVRNQWGPNAHKDGWYFLIPLELFSSWVRYAECQSIGELKLLPSTSVGDFVFQTAA